MQEIVPLIMSGGDPASVETLLNWQRVPWLEMNLTSSLNVERRPSPRMFTTHMPYHLMPTSFFKVKPKVSLPKVNVLDDEVTQVSIKVKSLW